MRAESASRGRVAILGPTLAAVSGVSTHVNMLLTSSLTRDFELLHFRVGSEGRDESVIGKLGRFCLSPMQLALFLAKSRVNVVHLNTSLDAKAFWRDLAYLVVAKLLRCSVVNQIHGGPNPGDFFARSAVLTWILRQFLVHSDAVTVLSSGELAAYTDFDPRIKVQLVPNAIDSAGLLDQQRSFNRDEPLRLVYVGRVIESKGLFDTVDALRQLRQQGRRFTFMVAGTGRDELRLRQAVRDAGIEDCTRLLGAVFGAAKNRLWLESDVFVFPSRHAEGLPYALLEAMAAGCVPIVTPVAAIPDVVQSELHGFLVPAGDATLVAAAVAKLDDNRARLAQMAQSARERICEFYTITRLAADFRAIYRKVLHEKICQGR
jgi:glycosyltransferase involved in cell wall biosynthesis